MFQRVHRDSPATRFTESQILMPFPCLSAGSSNCKRILVPFTGVKATNWRFLTERPFPRPFPQKPGCREGRSGPLVNLALQLRIKETVGRGLEYGETLGNRIAKCQGRIACRHVVFTSLSLSSSSSSWSSSSSLSLVVVAIGNSMYKSRKIEKKAKNATTATVTTVVAVFAKLLGSPAYA